MISFYLDKWGEDTVLVGTSDKNYKVKPDGPSIILMNASPITAYSTLGSDTKKVIEEYYLHYSKNLLCLESKKLYVP